MKSTHGMGENIYKTYLIRGQSPKYIRNSYNTIVEMDKLIFKRAKYLNRHFFKKAYKWPPGKFKNT